MIETKSEYPKLSDWSMPEAKQSRHQPISLFSAKTMDSTQLFLNDSQPNKFQSLCSLKKCRSLLSPCVQGLLFGILTNSLTLGIALALLFAPRHRTGVIITNELPPGTIILFSGNISTLNGTTHRWLLCDGSEASRVTYRDLFDVVGVSYGLGNGIDTFNLPDFRDRFPRGSNSASSSSLVTGGASSHVLTLAEMPAHVHGQGSLQILEGGNHTHNYFDPGHNHGGLTGNGPFSDSGSSAGSGSGVGNENGIHTHIIQKDFTNITIRSSGNHTHSLMGMTDLVGGNQPIDLLPSYQTIHYIIRA